MKQSFWILLIFLPILLLFTCSKQPDLPPGLYAQLITDKGDIVIRLEYQKAPMTVMNFVGLAEGKIKNTFRKEGEPYFDGLTFHRVEPGFVIQGGDPIGNGSGGPGYRFPNEIHPDLKHDGPGVVAMANAGPHTNGSQFYITLTATPHLDGNYSVFGKVVQGMEVVNKITRGDVIRNVKILRIGDEAKKFEVSQAAFDHLIQQAQTRLMNEAKLKREKDLQTIQSTWPEARLTDEGIFYKILRNGKGNTPKPGQTVLVHYRGTFLDGRVFDDSYSRNQPIAVPVGQGRVIKGWDLTLQKMKKGEKRMVIIPPELAYGDRGAGGVIPPNTFLVFEMELVDIQQ